MVVFFFNRSCVFQIKIVLFEFLLLITSRACLTSTLATLKSTVVSSQPTVWLTTAWWSNSPTLAVTPFSSPAEVPYLFSKACQYIFFPLDKLKPSPFLPYFQTCGQLQNIFAGTGCHRKATCTATALLPMRSSRGGLRSTRSRAPTQQVYS